MDNGHSLHNVHDLLLSVRKKILIAKITKSLNINVLGWLQKLV